MESAPPRKAYRHTLNYLNLPAFPRAAPSHETPKAGIQRLRRIARHDAPAFLVSEIRKHTTQTLAKSVVRKVRGCIWKSCEKGCSMRRLKCAPHLRKPADLATGLATAGFSEGQKNIGQHLRPLFKSKEDSNLHKPGRFAEIGLWA